MKIREKEKGQRDSQKGSLNGCSRDGIPHVQHRAAKAKPGERKRIKREQNGARGKLNTGGTLAARSTWPIG